MPNLISGKRLRKGGSGEFLATAGAMPQLPPTTSTTGFTLITNELYQTRYASSLGNIEFDNSRMYSSLSTGTITILATGTTTISTGTGSGSLVVTGGVGIGRNLWVKEDIHVNDLTIGRGFEGYNNIVFRGTATVVDYEYDNGQENIAIGYNVFGGLDTSYRSIAIGRDALSTGTHILNTIAIGDGALKQLGVVPDVVIGSIITATQAYPTVLSVPFHNLSNGAYVRINDVNGMTELNTQAFYVRVLNTLTIALYTDNILGTPSDSTGYSTYINGGTVSRILLKDNNIVIGTNAGRKLVDGKNNFLFGYEIAKNLTTGSYNFFAGTGGVNLTQGNNIISINGALIVDGVDNQINFGTVFYYNGQGSATLNANTEIGIGEQSVSPSTGALTVIGGAGISDDVHIGGLTTSTNPTTGALVVAGGLGVNGSINVEKQLNAIGSGKVELSPVGFNVYLEPTSGGKVTINPSGLGSIDNASIGLNTSAAASFTTASIVNSLAATSTTTGALTVVGGVGIGGDVYSNTGIEDENYLLYTPRVFVTTSTPAAPRLGDVWIDATNLAYLQYIKDGTSTFWIQVGAV